ncbi:hypothetical protein TNCV_3167431 [Trichonephila clavipes]|uniref:Reverse transcriptase domain-containing protein n=1 Tax=Trichonephila clavipes TaxID=2585209 RepID=A0A8X6RKD1_TRICX|nr:hypothetical protein TNCV_3167431 [Trichonephila clavipes]
MRQGLPQGAVLSCLIFNIMIDDLEAAIQKVPGVPCLFFADDGVLWDTRRNIHSLEDALKRSLLNPVICPELGISSPHHPRDLCLRERKMNH